jgi:MATE family multidrug resistance protein
MNSSKRDREAPASVLRALLSLAWPVVLARSAQAVIGFCDALMTAPLGEEAVAAVTTGSLNMFSVTIFPIGVVFIVQSFAAQLSSQGRMRAARRYAWYGLAVSAAAMVLAVASLPLIESLLSLFSYEPGVRRTMASYLSIRTFAVGAFVATEALGSWYGGLGNTRVHMVAGVVAMVANVFLNWVLIFGKLGAPALGVAGAAYASVIAAWLGFLVLLVPFWRGWWAGERGSEPLGLRIGELLRMLRFGLPNGFNWFLEFAAFIIFVNVIVAQLGTTVLAAMMIVFNINSVSFMPAFGLASAGAILSAQAIGKERHDDVPKIVRTTMGIAAVWQGSVGMVYLLLPEQLMSWFATPDADAKTMLSIGAVMLAISAAWQLFDAVSMTLSEVLRAAGDTTWSMWARMVVAWVLFIPSALISVSWLGGGYVAAIVSMVAYLAMLALVFWWRFRTGAWRKIDLTGQELDLIATEAA